MKENNTMKMVISDKKEINRAVLIIMIGLLESLLNKVITIEDAERALFTPYSYRILSELKIRTEILDLIMDGTELEDVESLVPEELEYNIQKMKKKASQLLLEVGKRDDYDWWIRENSNEINTKAEQDPID